jgi:tetratricopeptide (TPR) repeat protein
MIQAMPRRGLRIAAAIVLVLTSASPARGQTNSRERARELIDRADAAAQAGRTTEAVTLLEAAEREAPDWPELKVNLAAARSSAGDFKGAAAAARAALALDPSLDGARFNLGLALLKGGEPSGAAVALAAYANQAAPPAVHAALGLAWMQLDRAAEAAPVLQRSIDAGVRERDVLVAGGRAWIRTNDVPKAKLVGDILESVAPTWIETQMLLGDIADADQDWKRARTHYDAAIRLDAAAAQPRYSLGLVLYKEREYDTAADAFTRAIALNRSHVSAHYYFGLLELDRGNAPRAVTLLERAAILAPGRADVARDLGRAHLDAGQRDAAVRSLRKATVLAADDPSAWFLLARALKGTGHLEESQTAQAKAVELNQRLRDRLLQQVSGIKKN